MTFIDSITRLRLVAILGFLAVMAGSLSAHGPLHTFLMQKATIPLWSVAVVHHLIYTAILLPLALAAPRFSLTFLSFLGALILFSGSLYLYSLVQQHWMLYLTPLGGIGFLVGWGALFFEAGQKKI